MKKLLGYLVMVIMVFTACEGPPGRDGKDGANAKPTTWYIKNFEIKQNAWKLAGHEDQIGSYYYYIFDEKEITEDIYYDGLVICSYLYTDDAGYDVQSILPFTVYDIEEFYDGISVFENRYAIHYSYSVTHTVGNNPGTIEFRVTFSDFYTSNKPPEVCTFKLTLVY